MVPKELKYTKDHEWVRMEGGEAVVGISDHAQEALGDITFVELPVVGKKVAQHGGLGVIESVKAASDIFAPLSGTVAAQNAELDKAPELINKDPYGKGWICRLKDCDASGLAGLMDAAQYEAFTAEEK